METNIKELFEKIEILSKEILKKLDDLEESHKTNLENLKKINFLDEKE